MSSILKIVAVFFAMTIGASVFAQGFEQPPAPVVVERALVTYLAPSVVVPGTVVSLNDARLASELDAKLNWIADVGTEVSEGDTVARLEVITFRLYEMEAEKRVEKEKARVTFLRSEKERLQQLADSLDRFGTTISPTLRIAVRPFPAAAEFGFWQFGSAAGDTAFAPIVRIIFTPSIDFGLPNDRTR